MKTSLVVTLTCPDRPGVVERVTDVVAGFSANWEESRMARLGGDFAGIVRISVPQEQANALTQALQSMADEEMTVIVKAARSAAADAQQAGILYDLRLTGADHEGIVHDVASYLAGRGINVETMDTNVVQAPISATPLFEMTAQIKAPPDLSLPDLKASLLRVAEDLGVDIEVRPSQS
jgi:glycine cleavage system transcriptional repressor